VAVRTALLINGGAAIAVLAFIGALVREGGVSVKQIANISSGLLWFGGGVAAASWALALSYFTNFCYGRAERTKVFIWQHPYIVSGDHTPFWERLAFWFHVGAVAWAMLPLFLFIVGMWDVRNSIVSLGK
jgi:hypothetical protein